MDLVISGGSSFANVPASCWRLDGKLTLMGPDVTSVAKLGDLREARDLVIDGTNLTLIDTKSAIQVAGDITVRNNPKLTAITNIAPAATVKSLLVENNALITGLGTLGTVGVISGTTAIRGNLALAAAELGSATSLVGGVTISDNAVLKTIDLHAAQIVGDNAAGHDFVIRNNAMLTSIGSLAALQNVHGAMTIDNNDAMTTLGDTMMGTTWNDRHVIVDNALTITNNGALTAVNAGIAHIKTVTGGMTVSGNAALNGCETRAINCCVQGNWAANNQSITCGTTGYSWCWAQFNACPY